MKTKQIALNRLSIIFSMLLTLAFFSSCSSDEIAEPTAIINPEPEPEPEPEKNPDLGAINNLIAGLSYNSEDFLNVQDTGGAPSEKTITNENNRTSQPDKGLFQACLRQDFNMKSNFEDVAILRPTNGIVYPGALVFGNEGLLDGAPDPITLERAPVTLRLDLPGIGDQGNIVVDDPSKNSEVQTAIDKALEWWNANAYQDGYVNASNSSYQATTSYSSKQTSLDVGLNLEWATGAVASQFEYESNSVNQVATMAFKQVFYTVTMDTPETSNPASVFGPDLTLSQISGAISSDSPPAYVSSVSYGRIIMFRMETKEINTNISLDAVLEYASGVSGTATVNADYEEVIRNSSITVVTIGGNAEVASDAISAANIEEGPGSLNYILTGKNAIYSRDNPGVPIAYTIRYLKDNSLAKMGYTTDYIVENCTGFIKFDHENVVVVNDSNWDTRFRFLYKKPGTNDATQSKYYVVNNNKRVTASPPDGAHDVLVQFDFQEITLNWTRMGEFDLNYIPREKDYKVTCTKRDFLGFCTRLEVNPD